MKPMTQSGLLSEIETRARRRRHRFFKGLLPVLDRPLEILDVGGVHDYWKRAEDTAPLNANIVLFNVFSQSDLPAHFSSVVGDARDLSRYADRQFDVVFSNSVIGHVGSPQDQLRMAREIRRVGVRHFVQTPNHGFPIDWRTLVPGFHFLPATLQAWCFQRFPVGRYAKVDDWQAALELATRIRNIRKEDLPVFFPDSKVVCERFLGLTKSFMIHQGFEVDSARAEQAA
jgi:SAM-dependent methyltransferase